MKVDLTKLEPAKMGKLWLLYIMSSSVGSLCFATGFYMGSIYKSTVEHKINKQIDPVKESIVSPYRYSVQAGLYTSPAQADIVWQEIKSYSKADPKQAILPVHIANQTYYNIVLGEFSDKASAKALAETVKHQTDTRITPIVKQILITPIAG